MKNKSILIILLLISELSVNAQNHKLWGGIEVAYGFCLGNNYNINSELENENKSLSFIQGTIGYYVMPDISIGASIGIRSYNTPGLNIIPLSFDIRYHPFNNKKIVIGGSIGNSICTNEDYIKMNLVRYIFVGYKFWNIKNRSIIPSVGYSFYQYNITDTKNTKHNQSKNSIYVKIGFIY